MVIRRLGSHNVAGEAIAPGVDLARSRQMLEAVKALFSPSTSRNESPSAPPQSASNLVQVPPSSSSSAQVGASRSAQASIGLDELMQRGGLRTVSGYSQSLKGWVSGKMSNAINSVLGRQAALNPFGRSDALTFRGLERLVVNAQNTAILSSDNSASKAAHRGALIALREALQQYADHKDGKLQNVAAVLKGLDEAIEKLNISPNRHPEVASTIAPVPTGEINIIYAENNSNAVDVQPHGIASDAPAHPSTTDSSVENEYILYDPDVEDRYILYSKDPVDGELPATSVQDSKSSVDGPSDGKQERLSDSDSQVRLKVGPQSYGPLESEIRGITKDQKQRLEVLEKNSPEKAAEVLRRAHGDAIDLDVILDAAESGPFETRSTEELVAMKRARLTNPKSEGGLGIDLRDLKPMNRQGEGQSSDVILYEYKEPETGLIRQFAGKIHKEQKLRMHTLAEEEAIMARLPDHPNLVKSYGVHKIGDRRVLLQEYVPGGNLQSVFDNIKVSQLPRKEQLVLFQHVARQVFAGLAELQKLGIAHDDVRADNLLIDPKTFTIKLCDFGLADERGTIVEKPFPPKWSPPEVIRSLARRESITVDSFSASRVLVGELIAHLNLFNLSGDTQGLHSVTNDYVIASAKTGQSMPSKIPEKTRGLLNMLDSSGQMADFFEAISQPDPSQRLRANQALEHKFLANPPSSVQLEQLFNQIRSRSLKSEELTSMESNGRMKSNDRMESQTGDELWQKPTNYSF